MTPKEQSKASSNRTALLAMGAAVGMVSVVMLGLVMFCRWWTPRSQGDSTKIVEPCTVTLQSVQVREGDQITDSSLKAIQVRINDVNGLMLLDTGANRTMLSLEFCKKHSLWGRWVELNPNTTNLDGTHIFYAEEDLSIGPLRFRRFPFFAFNTDLLTKSLACDPLIGILGTDILNRYNYSIDFRNNLLHLGLPDEDADEAEVRLPMSIRNGMICVNMDIQGSTYELNLDTGSNRARLAEKHLAAYKSAVRRKKQTWNDINGWHTEIVNQVILPDIRLGAVSFGEITFDIRGDKSHISASMLKDLTVAIYPAQKVMTLTPYSPPDQSNSVTP